MWRAYAIAVSLVVLGAVLYPLTWKRYRDSFPLSSYPMFAHPKRAPILRSSYAYALDNGGQRTLLSPRFIGSEEVLQAQANLNRAVRAGGAAAAKLCQRIAVRVGDSRRGQLSTATMVRIVYARHDAVAYLTGRDRIGSETVKAQCDVRRRD